MPGSESNSHRPPSKESDVESRHAPSTVASAASAKHPANAGTTAEGAADVRKKISVPASPGGKRLRLPELVAGDRAPTPSRMEAGESSARSAPRGDDIGAPPAAALLSHTCSPTREPGFDGTGTLTANTGPVYGPQLASMLLEMAVRDAPLHGNGSPDSTLLINVLNAGSVETVRWLLGEVYSLQPESARVQESALLRLAGAAKKAEVRTKKALLRSVVQGFADLPEEERARASHMAARMVGAAALLSRYSDPRLFPASDDGADSTDEVLLRKLLHIAVEAGAGTSSDQERESNVRGLKRAVCQLGPRKALEVSTQCVTVLTDDERAKLKRDGCACVDREFRWIVANTVRPSGYADQVQLHLWIYSLVHSFFWVGFLLTLVEIALSQVLLRCRQPLILWLLFDGLLWLVTAGTTLLAYAIVSVVVSQALAQFEGGTSAAESEQPRSQLEGFTGCSGAELCRLFVVLGLLVLCMLVGGIGGFVATGLFVVTLMQGQGCAPLTVVICGSFIAWRDGNTIVWACLLYRDLRTLWHAKREYDRMPPRKRGTRPRSPAAVKTMFPEPPAAGKASVEGSSPTETPGKQESSAASAGAGREPELSTSLLGAKEKATDPEYGACPPLGKNRSASS